MSLLNLLDEQKMAEILDSTIATRIFEESNLMLIYTTSNKYPQAIPFDESDCHKPYDSMVVIKLTEYGIDITGTCYTERIEKYVIDELMTFANKKYHQELAYKAVEKQIGKDRSRLLSLAESMVGKINMTERDGYYDTIGERAFFALCEQGILDSEEAYTYGF